ncbi:hypothetical protein CHUAL_007596 [Chamberlinius hualienensis]
MKIGIFGATGNTGLAVVAMANKLGHEVTALVRDEARIPAELRDAIKKVVIGDVFDKQAVAEVVKEQDAIIVTLGTRNDLSITTMLSTGTQNILEAMKNAKVMRMSVCLSGFLFFEPEKLPPKFGDITNEHRRMLAALQESDRDWIGVCPPHIADDPPTMKYEVTEGKTSGRRIAKEDLAHFLVTCLSNDDYLHKTVGLGYLQPTQ